MRPDATIRCLLLLTSTAAASYLVHYKPSTPQRCRAAVVRLSASEGGGDDDAPGKLSLPQGDMERLRARIQKIQESGGALATPAQKYFDLAMAKPPQVLMAEFFQTRSTGVVQAMQQAVASLLGALPPFEFDAQLTTTGDKLAALMLQLQMTGYMLRNAEYVVKMRELLQLQSRSSAEYRAAFQRIDADQSGYIEVHEVQTLLQDVYKDEPVPPFEVTAFIELFDADGDGRISWEEFASALGALDASDDMSSTIGDLIPRLASEQPPEAGVGEDSEWGLIPAVNGTVTVKLDDGGEVEMDAAVYMAELKAEAQSLRAELAEAGASRRQSEVALASSLSAYMSSLPEPQLKQLTNGISDDVVTAMRQIVTYILRAPGGEGALDKDAEVTLEQQKLQQLCMYQLVLGYTLREAEATGEASEAVGR